mmetsp:Transcript_14393/g.16502  ORF Transcript_14393/g.16502 Transcript_14393/m.16502 type:complete len:90 (+) Transcript_14393:91-360(+)
MPYISNGEVRDRRSPWRFSIITDFFQGAYDLVAFFFNSMVNPPQIGQDNRYGSHQRADRRSNDGNSRGGGNIRGVKNLQGSTTAAASGG